MAGTAADKKLLADAQALLAKQKATLATLEKQQADAKAAAAKEAADAKAAATAQKLADQKAAREADLAAKAAARKPAGSSAPAASADSSTLAVKGTGIYQMLGGVLYFDGYPFTGTMDGKKYVGGAVDTSAPAVPAAPAKTEAQIYQEIKSADEFAKKQKAADAMTAVFKQYGLESLATFINTEIMADVAPEALLIKLYDQPEYQARFPGMKALQKANRTISEAEYIKIENSYKETLRFFDLPAGFMDDRATFGKMIGAEVSPKELQDRAQVAQDFARTTDPATRKALTEYYGVGEGGITAYVLDADKALPLIQKQAKAASLVGASGKAGFNFSNTEALARADKAAYSSMTVDDMAQKFGQAGTLRDTQQRLAFMEGDKYDQNEALSALIESDQGAVLQSKRRAEREAARFGGGSGVGAYSLKTGSNI